LRLFTESALTCLPSFLFHRVSRVGQKVASAIGFILLRDRPAIGASQSSVDARQSQEYIASANWLVSSRFHRNRGISPRLSTVLGSIRKNWNQIRHQLSTYFFIAAVFWATIST
jgi:hypothetical protein